MSHHWRNDFTPIELRYTIDGEVGRDQDRYRVTFRRAGGQKVINYYYDFSRHPLRPLLALYLLDEVEDLAGGSLNHRFRCAKLLEQFLSETGVGDLNPESFLLFIRWLSGAEKPDGTRRYKDSTIASAVNYIRMFYESGLRQQHPGWNQRDLDTMTGAAGKALRGHHQRSLQDSFDSAISLSSFSALAKAVAIESAQCQRAFAERNAGRRRSLYNLEAIGMKRIDPNPFVVFALQAALRLGLRASEFNSLRREDIRIDPLRGNHEIYVHAPDKADAFIPVDETFLAAWKLCEAWDEEARGLAEPATAQAFKDALLVYPETGSRHSPCALKRLNTYLLNSSHLPYFYAKWFRHLAKDEDGNELPLLHADGDPTQPFSVNYRRLRSAFAVRFAERERNRVLTAQVMRHKSVHTAERHYLQQTRLDHARKVQIALKAEAHFLALGLKNAVSAGITEETLHNARVAGAMTPHGLCNSALQGNECTRASDCLECEHLVVIASRKPRFIADRDAYLKTAEELETRGDLRSAENARGRASLCQAHLIRINEQFDGGIL